MNAEPAFDDPANLELPPARMQAMGEAVLARVMAHHAALADMPSRGDYAGIEDLCRAMREPVPERGVELDALLEPLFAVAPLSIGMVGAIVGLAFGSMLVIQLLKWIRR